ncbi:MAG: pilus assembly protein N-terminal domain-containing protein [Candidatus Omnitrophota bacterium]
MKKMFKAGKIRRYVILSVFIIANFIAYRCGNFTAEEMGGEIKLYLGEAKAMSVSNPIRIVIGNPAILDVVNVTKSEMTLNPKAKGITTLVFWDNFGEQSYQVKVLSENLQDAKRRIDNLLNKLALPCLSTHAAEDEGKILLMGRVKTAQERERIFTAIGTLKDKVVDLIEIKEEEAVVEIAVEVLELNKDATNTLGFTWPGSITLTEQGSPGITTSALEQVGTTDTITGGTAMGTKWSTLWKLLNLSRNQFSFTLEALVQEGKARVLSRPRLACQSGKEAELLVGGEKPIFTTSVATEGAEGTSVEYKEYGIKLKIKPTVNEDKKIKLALNVEVSDIGTAETIGAANAPTARAYPLSKRSASTELFINDGQCLAIGGLIKQKTEEDLRRVPWLSDIPILGLFFRRKVSKTGGGNGERGETELFITITPTIISREIDSENKEKAVQESREIKTTESQDIVMSGTEVEPVEQEIAAGEPQEILKPSESENLSFQGNRKFAGAVVKIYAEYPKDYLR